MRVLVLGGAGFIGRVVMRRLVEGGHDVYCMDINPGNSALDSLRENIKVCKGDITALHDLLRVMIQNPPDRVLNLAYYLPTSVTATDDPDFAVRINILGMNNCFEASRVCGVKRVTYASSLAVYGLQKLHGERLLTEEDPRYGTGSYAVSKFYNEHQAQWYNDAFDMQITGVRPANVMGTDKIYGSTEHVRCVVLPARGEPVRFPYRDNMYCVIHVEDTAEILVKVTLAEVTQHSIYNSGGTSISLGGLAEMVRGFLPEADISFDMDEGGKETSFIYMMDNTRLREEFDVTLPPLEERVKEMINEVREREGLPVVP